ncbi:hypothetical protein LCGC14_1777910 [marine sediment metagenome]|uniref:Uncharacterized protein n=1 Tax=marine sediment metagenome TaxID=412755 RepID=A0A0F9GW74_9ZZZZ
MLNREDLSYTVLDLFRRLEIIEFDLKMEKKKLWPFVEKLLNEYCYNVEESIISRWGRDIPLSLCGTQLNNVGSRELLSIDGKLKYLWWGFTYIIIDSIDNVYQLDYSTEPNFSIEDILIQFSKKIDYFYRNSNFTDVENPIYGYMYKHLEDQGIDNFIIETTNNGAVEWNSEGIYSFLREMTTITTITAYTTITTINN